MVTIFSEADAEAALGFSDTAETVDLIERAYREKANGAATLHPRQTIAYPQNGYYADSAIRLLCGFLPGSESAAMRVYPLSHERPNDATGPRVLDYTMGQELLLFYRYGHDMELAAIFSGYRIMNLRTAAPTGVATRHMAREGARTLALIGAGRHSTWQALAVCAVRPIEEIRVFSPTPARREGIARELSDHLGVDARATDSAEEAVRGADVVVTVTNANEPVIDAAWLAPGAHVNVIARGEIDEATILRADAIACSWREQILRDTPEFRPVGGLVRDGRIGEEAFRDLDDFIDGDRERADDAITLFLSQGVGLWDATIAPWAYDRLTAAGRGTQIDLG